MNANIVFILIIAIRNLVVAELFVDLKLNFISDGIVVYYGKYGGMGRYRMYIGKNQPIEKVVFEGSQVYPPIENQIQQELVVEVFDNIFSKYAIVHSFYGTIESHSYKKRSFYYYSHQICSEITIEAFLGQIRGEIELSYDVGTKVMHPYISQKIECNYNYAETYTIVEEINGYKLDGIEAPKYKFGRVYDSTKLIKMEYTRLDAFVTKCDSFTIEYNLFGDKIKFENSYGTLEFQIKTLVNQLVWDAQIKADTIVVQKDHLVAMDVKDKIDVKNSLEPIVLDISEQASPELFGIEKTTGRVGNGTYVMYQLRKDYANHYKIKTIVDTKANYIEIFKLDATFIFTSVEVFKNQFRTIVIINSLVSSNNNFHGRKDMFKRVAKYTTYYKKIVGSDKMVIHTGLEKIYPIKIDLYLDGPESSLFECKETSDARGNFLIYNIKTTNGRGLHYVYKYVFGNIWDNKPYELGNIPFEPNRKRYHVVRRNVCLTDLIIVKSKTELHLQNSDYRLYNFIFL